ncbi:MAG: hypothetical protein ACR2PR_09020 [Pseudohongiellaceae bacterium]
MTYHNNHAADFCNAAQQWANNTGGAIAHGDDPHHHTTAAAIKQQRQYIPADTDIIAAEYANGDNGDNTKTRRAGRPKMKPHDTKRMRQRRAECLNPDTIPKLAARCRAKITALITRQQRRQQPINHNRPAINCTAATQGRMF